MNVAVVLFESVFGFDFLARIFVFIENIRRKYIQKRRSTPSFFLFFLTFFWERETIYFIAWFAFSVLFPLLNIFVNNDGSYSATIVVWGKNLCN